MINRFAFRSLLWLLALVAPVVVEGQQRPLTTDDLFRLEELGDQFAVSPDGQWLAYVLKRPKATSVAHKYSYLEGNDRADVWLVSMNGGKPQNLTSGATEGAGYWMPSWSPDGERLALLSTRGENVHLWVWEKRAGALKKVTERGVDYSFQQAPYRWLSNERLVCAVLPEGRKPLQMMIVTRTPETAMREWPKAWKGQETTVSILESGLPMPLDKRPQGQLLLIDLIGGSNKTIAGYSFREPQISPDNQYIAALKQVDMTRPETSVTLRQGQSQLYQAIVADKQGSLLLTALAQVQEVQPNSLRWSPAGASLALLGRKSKAAKLQVFRCNVSRNDCQAVTGEEMTPTAAIWSGENKLLVRATTAGSPRADWWLFDGGNQKRNLTAKMKASPVALIREAVEGSFIGLADGEVWRIKIDGSEAQNLTTNFEPRVISLIWPRPNEAEAEPVKTAILGVRQGAQIEFERLDLTTGQMTAMASPHTQATLVDFVPQQEIAVFRASDRTGTYLWVGRVGAERFTAVLETNKFLNEIAQGELRRIEYRSLDGQDLRGWLILPVNYQEGKRYPLVAWVYPGTIVGERPSPMAQINNLHTLNMQLLAARGYAVLIPSMPLKPEGETTDPYLELTKGVLPAIDKAIELGIADPKKLAVMGHSYGGYGVYGLITQTNRFQAAISMAGLSDLGGFYSQFDIRFRYDEFANERLSNMAWAEGGQGRMGSAPWQDSGRYVRNSPLAYVERVETPLLIVQGDLDYVGIDQGERFFTALYRQNKRARFARYWGEEHVFESPANIRDMWRQIYEWLGEYLQPQSANRN